jgi:hypothetical protein
VSWTYEYREESRGAEWAWHEKALFRPAVLVQLAGTHTAPETFVALVDSGCDHILAPQWIARLVGVDPDPNREVSIRIAGAPRRVRFGDVTIRLCSPTTADGESDPEIVTEWQTQMGFFLDWSDPPWSVILGQCGFFDHFTVVMSRLAQRLTVEPAEFFDEQYPPGIATGRPRPSSRFRP